MTRKSQLTASLAYQGRRAKREALAAIEAEKKREAEMLKKKEFWFGILTLVVVILLGFLVWRTVVSFSAPTGTTSTNIAENSNTAGTTPNTGSSQYNLDPTVEGSWLPVDGVGQLQPGQICIGDIKVDGVTQYDSGSGEATIVVNNSTRNVEIYAEWGASRITGAWDLQTLISDQWTTGCDINRGSCSRVRIVTVTDSGQTVEFIDRLPKQ